jgi:hypothetical protein
VHGSVLVVGVSLSVNLSSLTIEQVIAKRKKLVSDAADGAVLQTRSCVLESSTPECADDAAQLVQLACGKQEGLLCLEPDFFNDDTNLSWAVDAVTMVAQAALGAAALRVDQYGRLCKPKEGEEGVHVLSGDEFTSLLCARIHHGDHCALLNLIHPHQEGTTRTPARRRSRSPLTSTPNDESAPPS